MRPFTDPVKLTRGRPPDDVGAADSPLPGGARLPEEARTAPQLVDLAEEAHALDQGPALAALPGGGRAGGEAAHALAEAPGQEDGHHSQEEEEGGVKKHFLIHSLMPPILSSSSGAT